ncbi:MAG: DUF721 domain-containing protein [Actinobacteria bacterium]|nr:MAG: DUF721 domain-containing protein [Actinomycetota bacterium]
MSSRTNVKKTRDLLLLRELIDQTTDRMGLKKGIERNMAVTCWPKVVGKEIAAKSKAVKIIKDTLYVKAASPAWSQQLSLMAEQLREKLNKHLGKELIKNIRFRS